MNSKALFILLLCGPVLGMTQLDTENADRDLTSIVTVLTDTPDANNPVLCQAYIALGDGSKDLDGTGGNFEFTVTVGGQTIQPDVKTIVFSTAIKSAFWSDIFPVPDNNEVILRVKSPNGADTDVDVTAYLYDVGTNVIEAKLPTNYIMGSSDQTDKDDEIDAILVDTNELQTDWTNGGRLDVIQDAIKAMTDLIAIVTTTVSDANDANSFTLTAGEDTNDAYFGHIIMVEDANDSHSELRYITEWNATRVLLVEDPFSFTPAVGDNVWIMGTGYGGYLYEIWNKLWRLQTPIYYYPAPSTGSGATGGAGGTSYYDRTGDDP